MLSFRSITKYVKNKLRRRYRELLLRWWYYSNYFSGGSTPEAMIPVLIFMIDGRVIHGGLVDRLKGIVSTYCLSKQLGYEFRMYFDHSMFPIVEYLLPVHPGIIIDEKELTFDPRYSRPIYLINEFLTERSSFKIKPGKMQYHIYCNMDYLPMLMPELDKVKLRETWAMLFFELFSFSPVLDSMFHNFVPRADKRHVGIHLRFSSSLGDFKDTTKFVLEKENQRRLILECIRKVEEIISLNPDSTFIVVTDSVKFIQAVKQEISPKVASLLVFMPGEIGHTELQQSDFVMQKTMIDFYALAQCQRVYQILGPYMYNSNYSRYASYLGNKSFKLLKFTL